VRITERELRSLIQRSLLDETYAQRNDALRDLIRSYIILEAENQGSEPEDPSFWREVGKELGRWGDAASDLGTTAAGGAALLGKAALDTFVGQAHAPGSDEDVRRAQASRVTLPNLVLPALGSMLTHLAMTKFRISAKIAENVGFPARDIIAGKYGQDAAKEIFAGSALHDILLAGSFVPGGAVPAMLLDSVVYATEGDRKSAMTTLALAAVFHAGGRISARRADDLRRGVISRTGQVEVLAPKSYPDLTAAAQKSKFTHPIPQADKKAAVLRFIDDVGKRMETAGIKDARQIAADAKSAVETESLTLAPTLDAGRVAEAQGAATALMTPGAGGVTPLAAASKKWKEIKVIVENPTVLPDEMRTGKDWFDSLVIRPDENLAPDVVENIFNPLRDKMMAAAARVRSNPSDAAARAELEALWKELTPYKNYAERPESQLTRAKSVLSTAKFKSTATLMYGKLGIDVNIIPIVGAQESVFEKYLQGYPRLVVPPGGQSPLGVRVVVLPADEGKSILDSVRGVSSKGEETRISTQNVGADTITIVPITNSAGVDSMPTPWMISHAIFDSAAGNLMIDQGKLPKTKALVTSVESVYTDLTTKLQTILDNALPYQDTGGYRINDPKAKSELLKIAAVSPEEERRVIEILNLRPGVVGKDPLSLIGMTVDSLWGRNARSMSAGIRDRSAAMIDIIIGARKIDNKILTLGDLRSTIQLTGNKKLIDYVGQVLNVQPDMSSVYSALDSYNDFVYANPAPMVGAKYKGFDPTLGILDSIGLKDTKQGTSDMSSYVSRGPTDHIAEIMTSSITKSEGYVPKFDHLTPDVQLVYGEEGVQAVREAAAEINRILGQGGSNAKEAFADDLKGNVMIVYPD
jgi:hypothetical protein